MKMGTVMSFTTPTTSFQSRASRSPVPIRLPIGFSPGQSSFAMASLMITTLGVSDRDLPDTPRVVIINEAMAKELWPGENPIGKRIGTGERDARDWNEVVGVVNDITVPIFIFQAPETRFQTYMPIYRAETPWITFSIRSSSDPRILEDAVRKAVARIDPDVAVYGLESAGERIGQWMSNFALISGVLAVMAALGLLLSSIGIYGVIASLAAQRTQEIGIRTA